jgi:hypothetical protein
VKKAKATARRRLRRTQTKREHTHSTRATAAVQEEPAVEPTPDSTDTTYTIEEIADGWRGTVEHATGKFFAEMTSARFRQGRLSATVSVYRDVGLLHRDTVNLTSDDARRRFLRAAQLVTLQPDVQVLLGRVLLALEEACRRAPEPTEAAPATDPSGTAASHPYVRTPAGIARRLVEGTILLCNADFEIIGERVEDDGFNPGRLSYEIEGRQGARCARTIVRADQFASLGWIPSMLGAGAIPTAGMAVRDHLRAAIQYLSHRPLSRRLIFTHAGWRDHNGQPIYCFNGGAIGRDGQVADVEARLGGSLARLRLPAPPSGEELSTAIRASLRLRDLGAAAIMHPLLAVTYLPPLRPLLGPHPPDFLPWLLGGSGAFKSELVALAMAHYGDFSRLNLPASFDATANALERLQFDTKDSLLAVDDYYPAPDRIRAQQMAQTAARLIRGIGNAQSRQRMAADTSSRPDLPPRSVALSSGEHLPPGYSTNARLFPIAVPRDAIDRTVLTAVQAQRSLLPLAMAAYLRHLASHWDEYATTLPARFETLRDEFAVTGTHRREPGQLAHLALGLEVFLQCAVEAGGLAMPEATAILDKHREALRELAAEHGVQQAEKSIATSFLRVLCDGFAARRFFLEDPSGGPPANTDPRTWGWEYGEGLERYYQHSSAAKLLGWYRDGVIGLIPEETFAAIRAAHPGRFELDNHSLCRELAEARIIAIQHDTKDGKKTPRYIVRVRGFPRRVLKLVLANVTLDEGDPEDTDAGNVFPLFPPGAHGGMSRDRAKTP